MVFDSIINRFHLRFKNRESAGNILAEAFICPVCTISMEPSDKISALVTCLFNIVSLTMEESFCCEKALLTRQMQTMTQVIFITNHSHDHLTNDY